MNASRWWSRLAALWRVPPDRESEYLRQQVTILGPGGSKKTATIVCLTSDYGVCRIQLLSDGLDISGSGACFFRAFCRVRERLAERDLYPYCYGASRNVYPSGMCRDMALGLKAYKLTIGEPAQDLVDIFESGPDIEVATVAKQEAFHKEWLDSE